MRWRRILYTGAAAASLFVAATVWSFRWPAEDFAALRGPAGQVQLTDRAGQPLSATYQSRWNVNDRLALHEMPEFLQQAFIAAEDRRFFAHGGVDWLARGHALWRRLQGQGGRGASTITEQAVRMLHPRPRNYWSKWIEGLEALALETRAGKADILEFYLNQVPYAANRRGVTQAARYYFGRDLATLNPREMLALAVLVRAPAKYDLRQAKVSIDGAIMRLAQQMASQGHMDAAALAALDHYDVALADKALPVEAMHFVDYLRGQAPAGLHGETRLRTTLDGGLQHFVTQLLESRLSALSARKAGHAAAVVVDHHTHEILAWVSVGAGCRAADYKNDGCKIDMVTAPRQPGSALKPFLYAAALEKGWTPATLIDDSPMADRIGGGLHHFRNYSRGYYGPVTLRQALGNSLNIPAVRTINFVGPQAYLARLHDLGFGSLSRAAAYYDDGLALGNGEVTLLEITRAYAALAAGGASHPLQAALDYRDHAAPHRVFSAEVATLTGNILSDPWARALEFGQGSVLNMGQQTAVKTGTSTDYRDAWAMGYDHRYAVGIWMGNADYTPMDGVTGALGPALALRGIFHELAKRVLPAPLPLSENLLRRDVCIDPAENIAGGCATMTEYFIGEPPARAETPATVKAPVIIRPTQGLEMALDPRIAPADQTFRMQLRHLPADARAEWHIDGALFGETLGDTLDWPLSRGRHRVQAVIRHDGKRTETGVTEFIVK